MAPTDPAANATSWVFWPSAYPLDSTGYLVGWRKQGIYCVASLVQVESRAFLKELAARLENDSSDHVAARVLGELNPWEGPSPNPAISTEKDKDWITLIATGKTLAIKGLRDHHVIVIEYDRPSMRKHHFLSLRPLLKPSLLPNGLCTLTDSSKTSQLAKNIKLFEKLYPERSLPGGCGHPREMSSIIDFVNSSEKLDNEVHHPAAPSKMMKRKKLGLHHPPGSFVSQPAPLRYSLLALSAFLQQINVRLAEISSWPSRYRKITRDEVTDLPERRAEYVMLFNTLWLIANDVILGRAIGRVLMDNSLTLAEWLEYHLRTYTVNLAKSALDWTNSYPVGLKLNDQLGRAFCNGSKMAVDVWLVFVLKHAFLALPKMIWIAGFISLLGTTFTLSIASDFLTISTFHLWVIYRLFALIFDCQLKFLSVLFNIFRGRKYNVMKKRNEPATYQLDQLILGAILFTLATFLFPTVLAFYMVASAFRVLIVWLHGIIGTGLFVLNHFPLFVVTLRLKDPARLPAGICFIPLEDGPPMRFKLRNVPVGLTWIFADYISLWASLTSHYSPRQLVYHLCIGKPIAPLASYTIYQRP